MIDKIWNWLNEKWMFEEPEDINIAYKATFGSVHGTKVLYHLMDRFYCVTYNGTDPFLGTTLNGQRMVLQEILERIDQVEHPEKYKNKPVETEKEVPSYGI